MIIPRLKKAFKRSRRFSAAYRAVRDVLFDGAPPRPTPMGFLFSGLPSMADGTFEPEETKIVLRLLERAEVFINVGANTGYYCCLALKNGKRVIAFEPIEQNLRKLYANIKANHWEDGVEVFPVALSDRPGLIDIHGGGTGASLVQGWGGVEESYSRSAPALTMDGALGGRLSGRRCLVLADVEGAEYALLQGAASFLAMTPKPVWMIEICVHENQPKGRRVNPSLVPTFQAFFDKGYEAWTAGARVRPVLPEEVRRAQETGLSTFDTYNFLFTERGSMPGLLSS